MDSNRIERAILLAERRRGVISADQMNRLGIPNYTIRRLVRSGHLAGLYPAVFRFNGNRLEWPARVAGAVTWGGDEAVASHRCAARVHELSIKSDVVEITLPKRVRAPDGMKVHYGKIDPIDVRRIDGIPVTSIPRTLLTLGAVVPPSVGRASVGLRPSGTCSTSECPCQKRSAAN